MDQGLIELIRELAEPIGAVSIKRMFGGVGLFRDGRMFGLVAMDVLYFKVDAESEALFTAEGLEPFGYTAKTGDRVIMSYRRAPERVFDDPDEFVVWARHGIGAAMRSLEAGRAKKPRAPRTAGGAGTTAKKRRGVSTVE